jgi:hypothetical protein
MFGGKTGEEPYQSTDYVSARCIIMFIEANQAGDLLASFIGAEIWSPPLALKSLITIWVEGFFLPPVCHQKDRGTSRYSLSSDSKHFQEFFHYLCHPKQLRRDLPICKVYLCEFQRVQKFFVILAATLPIKGLKHSRGPMILEPNPAFVAFHFGSSVLRFTQINRSNSHAGNRFLDSLIP